MAITAYDYEACADEAAKFVAEWRVQQVLSRDPSPFHLSKASFPISEGLAASLRNPSIEFESALDARLSHGVVRLWRKIFRKSKKFTISKGVLMIE